MKKQNKNRIAKHVAVTVFLGSFVLFCINFQSCEINSIDNDFDYILDIPKQYNEVGKLHNEGLDHVFRVIRKKHLENMNESRNSLKSVQNIDYISIVTEATLDFCKKNLKNKKSFSVIEDFAIKSKLKSGELNLAETNDLSPIQKELLSQITESMKSKYSSNNLTKLKNDLELINLRAARVLSETDAAPIYCATSTAYATYQYWHRNYRKWYFALNYPEILKKYEEEELNKLQLKNGNLLLKSGDGSTSWWNDTWNFVEDWWNDSWADEEKTEWMLETLEEIGTTDVIGAVSGGKVASVPGAIGVGCIASAIDGAKRFVDHYKD